MKKGNVKKGFKAYYHVTGWYPINLGLNIDFQSPNVEIHIPFGFIRLGWDTIPKGFHSEGNNKFINRSFGLY